MIDRITLSPWTALALAASLLATPAPGRASIGYWPLAFEANHGQADPQVRFFARGAGQAVFLTDEGARIVVGTAPDEPPALIDVRFDGGRVAVPLAGATLPGTANYLRGGDGGAQLADIPTYAKVTYAGVYPGVDVAYYGAGGVLEYDVIVAPHTDPKRVALRFGGADAVRVDAEGALVLRASGRDVTFRKPAAYQEIGGHRREVDARYVLRRDGCVGFRTGRYDRRHPLVIDPVLALSTNLWGTATGVATDAAGNIYVAGSVWTSDLPSAGGYLTQQAGTQDAYVVKLNPAGTTALYATYLGVRRAATQGLGIAVDGTGSAYVTGTTTSGAFPVTAGAYQSTGTTFVTKLAPAGNALAYSTLFAAPVAAIAVHADGSVTLAGTTAALATTAGAFQMAKTAPTSPYVARLNAFGTGLVYATFVGGSAADEARAVAVDAGGNAYVAGVARSVDFPTRNALRSTRSGSTDAFVAKVSATGTQLLYATYLGGTLDERAFGVAVDSAGQATVVGWTTSWDFPVTPGAFQPRIGVLSQNLSNAFITKLDAAGNSLLWSTYLGGAWCQGAGTGSCFGFFNADDGIDVATTVVSDAAGFTYVGGYATSTLFPQVESIERFPSGGDVQRVPFVARFRPGGGRLAYSVVVGKRTSTASVGQIALDGAGGVVAVGSTPGEMFPLTAGAVLGTSQSFAFKLAAANHPTLVRSSPNPAHRTQTLLLVADADAATVGTVTFRDGANVLGTAGVANGVASLSVVLAPGIHRITAVNSADGKVSPPYFQIVSGQ